MGASTERTTTLHTSGLDITFGWTRISAWTTHTFCLPRTGPRKNEKKLPCNMRCAGSNCTQNGGCGGGGRWIRNCPRVVREYDFLCSSFLPCVPYLRQQRTSSDGSCCCCRTFLLSLLLCWVLGRTRW